MCRSLSASLLETLKTFCRCGLLKPVGCPKPLQCAISPFDKMVPEPLNSLFADLLFIAADCHGGIKMRMHTDRSLDELEIVTQDLGKYLRRLRTESADLPTKELPREVRARQRRNEGRPQAPAAPSTAQIRTLNLETFKTHSIGDYVPDIRRIGTTDNYDTRLVGSDLG